MTSSSVSNISGSMTLAQGVESKNASRLKQDFDMLLNQRPVKEVKQDGTYENVNAVLPQVQQSYEKATTESGYKETAKINTKNAGKDVVEQAKEGYEELKEEVTQVLSEELEVSEEELLEVMNTLGITFENLLQGNGLKELMMEISGTEDVTDLLVNDVFQKLMQEIEVLVQEFANEMDISSEELEMILQQLAGKETEVYQDEANQNMVSVEENNQTEVQSLPDETGSVEETLKQEQPQTEQNNKMLQMNEAVVDEVNAENTASQDSAGDELNQKQSPEGKETGTSLKTELSYETAQNQVSYQTIQTTVNAAGEEIVQVVERVFVDVEDIMNQITEFTKVTVEQTQSSIEMQLNPEHLGKIYLQVVSKEGMITAQLTAQNEAVQQALESQIAVLKENMNQQGLKIEAVEVTIASHEFDQNFTGNAQQEAQEQLEKETKKSQRFISINQLDELAGIMTEEESLVAKMMLENGNSMDMTA